MPTIRVNDIDMYYEIYGEGEPLLLIAGLGSDLSGWYQLTPGLSAGYRVIAFDNRGIGRTDKPYKPYSMEMMCDDINGLMGSLGIEKAHIFGVSMGGMIGQNFGLLYPERIASLMLGCTRPGGSHSIPEQDDTRAQLNPELIESLTPEERAKNMLPVIFPQEFIDNNPDFIRDHIRRILDNPIDPVGYARQIAAADAHDVYDRLPQITVPTLVLHGSADRLIPAENGRIIASRIPGAELVIMEGLGHGFTSQKPDEVVEIVVDFMKRHPL